MLSSIEAVLDYQNHLRIAKLFLIIRTVCDYYIYSWWSWPVLMIRANIDYQSKSQLLELCLNIKVIEFLLFDKFGKNASRIWALAFGDTLLFCLTENFSIWFSAENFVLRTRFSRTFFYFEKESRYILGHSRNEIYKNCFGNNNVSKQ